MGNKVSLWDDFVDAVKSNNVGKLHNVWLRSYETLDHIYQRKLVDLAIQNNNKEVLEFMIKRFDFPGQDKGAMFSQLLADILKQDGDNALEMFKFLFPLVYPHIVYTSNILPIVLTLFKKYPQTDFDYNMFLQMFICGGNFPAFDMMLQTFPNYELVPNLWWDCIIRLNVEEFEPYVKRLLQDERFDWRFLPDNQRYLVDEKVQAQREKQREQHTKLHLTLRNKDLPVPITETAIREKIIFEKAYSELCADLKADQVPSIELVELAKLLNVKFSRIYSDRQQICNAVGKRLQHYLHK